MSANRITYWLSGGVSNTSPSMSLGGPISSAPPRVVSKFGLSNPTPFPGITFVAASIRHMHPINRANNPSILDFPKPMTVYWSGNSTKDLRVAFADEGGVLSNSMIVTQSGRWVTRKLTYGSGGFAYDTVIVLCLQPSVLTPVTAIDNLTLHV